MILTTTLYLAFITLVSVVTCINGAYLSVTFSDASCSASNRIAFYYDTRASVTCVAAACAATGDGNYFQITCPTSLSVIDTSTFAMVNYYLGLTACTGETVVYGGILGLSAVRVRTPLATVTSAFTQLTSTTFQHIKCTLLSVCTTVSPPSTCSSGTSLEIGTYWKGTMPSVVTPIAAPVTPVTAPVAPTPIATPVAVPVATPIAAVPTPIAVPVAAPVTAPVAAAPVDVPVAAIPVATPIVDPVTPIAVSPVATPIDAPITAPVTPVAAPVVTPIDVPVAVPVTPVTSGTNSVFAFSISSLYIQSDGKLALFIITNTMNSGFYLTSPSVVTKPSGVDLVSDNAPSYIQRQVWSFKTSSQVADYSGDYAISFTRTDGTASQTVTAQFILSLAASKLYNNDGLTLPTVLSFWGSSSFTGSQQKTTYTSLDTIFVRSTVAIQNNQDQNSYVNSIYNVWLCYTVDDSVPVYNPANNQYGCTAQTWNVRPLSRLVYNGQLTTGVLEDQFSTVVYNTIGGLSSVNSGVSFKSAPLTILKTGTFYIQIESRINIPVGKRSVMTEQASSHEIHDFTVDIGAIAAGTMPVRHIASSAPLIQLCTVIAIFSVILLL